MQATPASQSQSKPAHHYQPMIVVLAAFCVGVLADRTIGISAQLWWSIGLLSLIAWLLAERRGGHRAAGVLLLFAVAATSASWSHFAWNVFRADEIGRAATEDPLPVCLRATVVRGPVLMPAPAFDPMRAMPVSDQNRLDLRIGAVRNGDIWRPASGRARLIVDGHLLDVSAGDEVLVFGMLAAPAAPANPGEFDYAAHTRADRQLAILRTGFPDCVTRTSESSSLNAGRLMHEVRSYGDRVLWRHLGHERSGLASAVLLGSREQVDWEQTEAFLTTGTVHILSISGLHVGLLSGFLFFACRVAMMPRRLSLVLVALLTIFYALLTGAEPPAVRATLMVLVVCGGAWSGNRILAMNSLAAAALIVLAKNPADLFRVGPQLSFLSVGCLAWLSSRREDRQPEDPLDRLIAQTRPWPERVTRKCAGGIMKTIALGALLWAVTTPLVMTHFHLISPAAVILNAVLAIPVLLAMLSGFATILAALLFPPLAPLFASGCDLNLSLLGGVIGWASASGFSHLWVSGPGVWWLLVFYGAIILTATVPKCALPRRWCFALAAAWCGIGAAAGWMQSRDARGLDCTFASVGHGCSVVLELPGGATVLYDAGRLGSPLSGARSIAGCLWSRGIRHLDAVVISHADVDHYNALPELLERFSVGVAYVSPVMFGDDSGGLRALRSALEAHGTKVEVVWSGDRLRTDGDCSIEVLHPPRRGVLGSDNANSIVLLVEFAGRRILLPGDLETPGLEDVLAEAPLDCDIVLAPHHGSRRSDPAGFAAWSTPEVVVISGGHERDLPFVTQTYAAAGANVLDTGTRGAISVTIAPNGRMDTASWRNVSPVQQ